MNTANPSHSPDDWQTLDEFVLPIQGEINESVTARLGNILESLHLSAPFIDRVLQSLQEALARLIEIEATDRPGYIHVSLLSLADCLSNGQTWGFFRIEKTGEAYSNPKVYDHSIEFYIYPER